MPAVSVSPQQFLIDQRGACARISPNGQRRIPSASNVLYPLVQAVASAASVVPKVQAADLLVACHPHVAHVGALAVGKPAVVAAPRPACFWEILLITPAPVQTAGPPNLGMSTAQLSPESLAEQPPTPGGRQAGAPLPMLPAPLATPTALTIAAHYIQLHALTLVQHEDVN